MGETVSILEGNTFVVSDRRGDIDASPDEPHGLFNLGEGSPMTALLRGAMAFEGDLLLVAKLDKYAR